MNQLTGMLSRIGIIVILLYFAIFSTARQVAAVEPALATGVEYTLAYPGILPDNPFYFLKVARDKLVSWLIFDSNQKAFYLLLTADKKVAAAQILADRGKEALVATTLTYGEADFGQAVDLAVAAKGSGKDTTDLVAKLAVAGAKHAAVLAKINAMTSEKESLVMAKAYQDNLNSQKRIMELLTAR